MWYEYDLYPETLRERTSRPLTEQPTLHEGVIIVQSRLGSWTEIGAHTSIVESSFGDYSYTAGDAQIIYSQIGKFCSIASHVRINPGNHPMQRVTQHHSTYRRKLFGFRETDDAAFFDWRRQHRCIVGHDVWIGHGAILLPGVSVGTGAVIGAGAVVTRDIGAYEIAVGVPARTVRMRFAPPISERLLALAWWDWDRATLEARFDDLSGDVEQFLEKYG